MEQRFDKDDIKRIFEAHGKMVGKITIKEEEIIVEQVFERQAIKAIWDTKETEVIDIRFEDDCMVIVTKPKPELPPSPLPSLTLHVQK